MIHVARYALITFGIVIGIPYVLTLIGMAKIADRHNRRPVRTGGGSKPSTGVATPDYLPGA